MDVGTTRMPTTRFSTGWLSRVTRAVLASSCAHFTRPRSQSGRPRASFARRLSLDRFRAWTGAGVRTATCAGRSRPRPRSSVARLWACWLRWRLCGRLRPHVIPAVQGYSRGSRSVRGACPWGRVGVHPLGCSVNASLLTGSRLCTYPPSHATPVRASACRVDRPSGRTRCRPIDSSVAPCGRLHLCGGVRVRQRMFARCASRLRTRRLPSCPRLGPQAPDPAVRVRPSRRRLTIVGLGGRVPRLPTHCPCGITCRLAVAGLSIESGAIGRANGSTSQRLNAVTFVTTPVTP